MSDFSNSLICRVDVVVLKVGITVFIYFSLISVVVWPSSTVLGFVGSTGFMIFLIKLGFVIWLDFVFCECW